MQISAWQEDGCSYMRSLWPAAPLLASAILALALVPAGGAEAIIPVHDRSVVPHGLHDGDRFRLLFVTSEQTSITPPGRGDFTFFDQYVQNAISNGDSAIQPYANAFKVMASCGLHSAISHTNSWPDRGEYLSIPIYWLGGDKAANHYRQFWQGSWSSNDARDEFMNKISTLAWTGTANNNGIVAINDPGNDGFNFTTRSVCDRDVAVGSPNTHDREMHYTTKASHYSAAMYGLSDVLTVSPSPSIVNELAVKHTTTYTATVSWKAPSYSGGTPIHDYDVQVRTSGGSWTGSTPAHHGTATTITLTGLDPVTQYEVRVRANNHGTDQSGAASSTLRGPWSHSVSFNTTHLVPGAPVMVSVTASQHEAVVSWNPPGGDVPINDYDMSFRNVGASSWIWAGVHGNATTFTLINLHADTEYEVRVKANNHDGHSPWSAVTTFRTITTPTALPSSSPIVPDGLGSGDQFRLLFVTSGSMHANSSNITSYNNFAARHASNGHDDIAAFAADFRAFGSTRNFDARDNVNMRYTDSDKGLPIYWLGGGKVADDYREFWSGCWDSNVPRNENGSVVSGSSIRVWTGIDQRPASWEPLGGYLVTIGNPSDHCREIDASTGERIDGGGRSAEFGFAPLYALSPNLTVR